MALWPSTGQPFATLERSRRPEVDDPAPRRPDDRLCRLLCSTADPPRSRQSGPWPSVIYVGSLGASHWLGRRLPDPPGREEVLARSSASSSSTSPSSPSPAATGRIWAYRRGRDSVGPLLQKLGFARFEEAWGPEVSMRGVYERWGKQPESAAWPISRRTRPWR